jgi:hypothetical protein
MHAFRGRFLPVAPKAQKLRTVKALQARAEIVADRLLHVVRRVRAEPPVGGRKPIALLHGGA